ncbi:MAG: S9 family peptidase [Acidobacteriaceae bacterium]|nr:S9 family peptidase [Acidobacteriaceae bacterium]
MRNAVVLAALAVAGLVYPQSSGIDTIINDLQQVRWFSGVSISPDGRWVAYTENAVGDEQASEIYLRNRTDPSAKPRHVSAPGASANSREHDVAWSPDSTQLAFLSNTDSSQDQVYVAAVPEGAVRRLTNLKGHLGDVQWSPDGKQIVFLYAEAGGGGGPLEAAAVQTGEIGSAIHNQQITTIDVAGGEMRKVSPPSLNIYEYDWAADGKRFAAIAAPGPADDNWWIAKLYTLDAASGEMKIIYSPPVQQQIAIPRWSPDSKQIAFIGGLMSDEGFVGGDIFVLDAQGGRPKNLTSGQRLSASSVRWTGENRLLFTAAFDGGGEIGTLDLRSPQLDTLWEGDHNPTSLVAARDGKTTAVIRSNWQQPPEVWTGAIGNWQKLTDENAAQRRHWGKAESMFWNSGAYRVQGWLLYPENFDPSKRYPMIVSIHGGPAGERSASWPNTHFDMSVIAGLGYFVLFPNPRGSYGEGEAFTRANVMDFGGGDLKDVLAGVDAVLKKAPVDANRIGVTGWSYGGYMTMWTVTQTNRFHAAVAGAGVANWQSYYGENLIDKWMIPYFGASVYQDPAVYAKSSPINYITQVKTPTLVIVGQNDAECPAPQSFEFWHALKTLGIPTKLIVYPGQGHAFRDPEANADRMRRAAPWFDQYLQAQPH